MDGAQGKDYRWQQQVELLPPIACYYGKICPARFRVDTMSSSRNTRRIIQLHLSVSPLKVHMRTPHA